jgi:glucan 1,3-beta-glucosidase
MPAFLELIGPGEGRTHSPSTMALGLVLAVITLTATEIALGLVFDPRWRDFPFASLTMAAVPFCTLALLNRPMSGARPVAEAVFAALFAGAALFAIFNEGSHNWQALWTSGAYFLLGATLWQARSVAVAEKTSAVAITIPQMDVSAGKVPALNPAE